MPSTYYYLLKTFTKAKWNKLAPYYNYNYYIKLINSLLLKASIKFNPLRKIILKEAKAAKAYILKNLNKRFIKLINTL